MFKKYCDSESNTFHKKYRNSDTEKSIAMQYRMLLVLRYLQPRDLIYYVINYLRGKYIGATQTKLSQVKKYCIGNEKVNRSNLFKKNNAQ